MASLLGKADATIAGMSYREAMADVTPDLKGVYQDKVRNQAMFQKGVEDHFDTLYADNNLLADQLKEATTLAMANLGTDYEGMELFNTALTSMKTRMKALPKGKKGDFERAKIRGEMAELKRSTDGMEATQTMLGTMIEAGDFDTQATGKLNLSQLNAIASRDAKRKIVNGKLFYSFKNPAGGKDIEVDQQVLKDMLIQTDPEHQGNFNKIHEGSNAQGKIEGNEFNRELYANKYEESFTSKKVFATNVNKKQHDLEYSLKEALQGKDTAGTLKLDSIYETLMSIGNKDNFFNGSDTDKDGDVDAQDFASAENGIALIESLTDINSNNFNFQVAKKVAAEFYADNISAKEFEVGVSLRAIVPQWKKEGYPNKGAFLKAVKTANNDESGAVDFSKNKVQKLNGANWNSGNATSVYNDIKAGVGFSAKDPATGEINDYSYHVVGEKGGWYQNYRVGDNENTTESYIGPNGGDVGKIFTNDPRFRNIQTSVTVEEDIEGNVTNSREINIKTKTKKKYGSFKKGTQSIGLESILSSLQSFDKDKTLIQYQALIKFQEEVKNDTYDNRYKLVQHINSENNTSIGMDQLDTMINDLVADTDPLNNK
tara:strand:+ start:1238 stop:3037 length:1800 start_codon:yes stop_codon:yes gene_type:complete